MQLNDKYLTTEEVEIIYKIKRKTQNTLRQKRKIAYTKIGRDCVYKPEWIEEYLAKNMVEAAS